MDIMNIEFWSRVKGFLEGLSFAATAFAAIVGLIGLWFVILQLNATQKQLKANENATQGATYQNLMSSMGGTLALVIQDDDVAKIYLDGTAGDIRQDEQPAKWLRFVWLEASIFNFHESIFYQLHKGQVEPALWICWHHQIIKEVGNIGMRTWWNEYRTTFSVEFRTLIDGAIQNKELETQLSKRREELRQRDGEADQQGANSPLSG